MNSMRPIYDYMLLPEEKTPDFVFKSGRTDLIWTFRVCAIAVEECSHPALWNLIVAQCVDEYGKRMTAEEFVTDFFTRVIVGKSDLFIGEKKP